MARKLSLDERRDIIKKENVCFTCLKRGHIAKRCRVRIKCDWCARRHVLLMCPGLGANEKTERKQTEHSNANVVKTSSSELGLAVLSEWPSVCLQTLRVRMYSDTGEKVVRAVIDTGSHRSYVRDVAKELGYESRGKQKVTLSLFGGIKSTKDTHDIYNIRLKNLDNSFACNFCVMNKDIICEPLESIKTGEWMKELRAKKIVLSDVGLNANPIDVLIGADVAGRLMTGKKYDFDSGLTAFETCLGWTLMGKLRTKTARCDSAVMITSMFVQEANLTDLWRLDVLGISDPIEKLEKFE